MQSRAVYLVSPSNMSNLLKNNAYHILGLDATVSQKDIVKRSRDLTKFIQIDEIPEYDLDFGIFKNFRTENSVKDAIQRLTSPKKQIKESFFWFNIADEVDEQAVGILRKNDPEGAIKVWEHHSQDDSIKSLFYKKNLAILYCILLFKKYDAHHLNASLKVWNEIVNSTKFWNAFSKVYKLHDELNTNQETIDEFHNDCTSYISDLYTELAEERKDNKYVAEFSSTFNMKGDRTSKELLAPIFNEMTVAIERLENLKVAEDGVFHKEKSVALKENVTILQNGCNKLIELGLFADSQAKIVRERAAEILRLISIDLHNDPLNEVQASLSLAKIALQISGTEGSKNKIQEDVNQIQKNLDYKNNESKFQATIDPIMADYKSGKTERALKTINEYLYNETTEESLKKSLREIKEVIEERVTKSGAPISKAPTMYTLNGVGTKYTLNGVGTKIYGDTLYFVFLFVPIFPIARYNLENQGNSYSFHGKLELHKWQNIWRSIAILVIIVMVISSMKG